MKKVLDNTSTIGYTIIITINKETKMKKGNQWDKLMALHLETKDLLCLLRLGSEYGKYADRTDPSAFGRLAELRLGVKATTAVRHKRRFEKMYPSQREAA